MALTLIPTALATLAAVKGWVSTPDVTLSAGVDDVLIRLINSASRLALNVMSRSSFLARTVNEVRNGVGTPDLMLKQWPVLGEISSFTIDGVPLAAQSPQYSGTGWVIQNPWEGMGPGSPAVVSNVGSIFPAGRANLRLTYAAGYAVLAEPHTIPSNGQVTPDKPLGPYTADYRVVGADGTVFTKIASGTPATNQYVAPGLVGVDPQYYLFNTAQQGTAVLISYSYIPAEIEYATAKWVGEFFSYKSRPGLRSKSLGGQETMSWDLSDMPKDVKLDYLQYAQNVPIV